MTNAAQPGFRSLLSKGRSTNSQGENAHHQIMIVFGLIDLLLREPENGVFIHDNEARPLPVCRFSKARDEVSTVLLQLRKSLASIE